MNPATEEEGSQTKIDRRERKVAWAMLIACPLSVMLLFVYVTLGYAQGLTAGHPMEYLQMSCILWAVIMAVLPAFRLMRMISLPYWFIILLYADMYMYILSLTHGFYFDLPWWANFTHVISSMVVTAIVFMALCLMEKHSPSHNTLGSRGGITTVLLMIGLCFGAVWEIMEGFTDIITQVDYMSYGSVHTLGNLFADALGAVLMTMIAWVIMGRQSAKQIASKVRIGSKNIDKHTHGGY
ncbi:MAG: hypothetical protein LBV13_06310 [Methanomassiliicoccaceae archaeon]|nr:hypothetical protein [Methanomassiliicoccaceae archaeon]